MLNMDTIKFRDNLDDIGKFWSDYEIVEYLAGLLYSMEDDYQARKAQKIVNDFLDKFRKLNGVNKLVTTCIYHSTLKDLMPKLKDILLSIPEFVELNERKDNGEFIDLDAFFQNLWYALNSKLMVDAFYSCKKFDIIPN